MQKFLLSGDPGVANFGIVIWNVETGKCVLSTKLQHTIKDLKEDFSEQLSRFLEEIDNLLEQAGFDAEEDDLVIALERFISRGMRSTSTPELIPMMIGALATRSDTTLLYIAATWKGYTNRALRSLGATLEINAKNRDRMLQKGISRSIYKMWGRKLGGGAHILDAALIGRHALHEEYGIARPTSINDFRQLYYEVRNALRMPAKKR